MTLEIIIPSPGESITEVEMATWFVEDGALVNKDQEVGEIESEKATLPLIAEKGGRIKIIIEEGATAKVGDTACSIDTSVEVKEAKTKPSHTKTETSDHQSTIQEEPVKKERSKVKVTPVAREIMEREGLSVDDIIQGLKKITTKEVRAVINHGNLITAPAPESKEASREVKRRKMSQLRKKISEMLVAVKNETAMLTTFNEADMSAIINLRKKYQEQFIEKHGIKIGFMSFFTKAVTEALKLYPSVNSFLDGDEVVSPVYYDIGIAVQTDKGLMVPVIRNTETMSLAEIEKNIADLAGKARKARLGINEMSGGTFTITNGGIFGSMLSTPILNPPQSGILGMHNIVERPVAIDGKVVIRPMMNIALSYDHRVIDGRDSVGFLIAVKEFIEDPGKMLFGGSSQNQVLLDL